MLITPPSPQPHSPEYGGEGRYCPDEEASLCLPPLACGGVPLAIWAGLALLTGTFVGACFLHVPGSTAKADAPASPGNTVRAVCFGHVDVEKGLTPLYPTQPGRIVATTDDVCEGEHSGQEGRRLSSAVDDRHAQELFNQAEADVEAGELQLRNRLSRW